MTSASVQKRPNDLFVSYSHKDRVQVTPIVEWLSRCAGLKIWFDDRDGDAGQRNTDLLENGLRSARGALFILSSNRCKTTWCKDEHERALNERRKTDPPYLVLAVKIDDSETPPWFELSNVLDFRQFNAASAAALLRSLAPTAPNRFDCERDVYVAAPWRRPDFVTPAVTALHSMGCRTVGDSPDLPHFEDAESRIRSIIRTARGLVALIAFDPSKPAGCSPWIIQEAEIARAGGHPYIVFAEQNVTLPEDLISQAFGAQAFRIPKDPSRSDFQEVLERFDEEIMRRPYAEVRTFSFLATSLRGLPSEIDELISAAQHASNLACVLGQRLTGAHAQQAIIDRIRNAAFVIADVSDGNRNSLIEAGAALGARTPLHLMCKVPEDGSLKTRFMFQDREINWYTTPLERLGTVYRIARTYRRRIL